MTQFVIGAPPASPMVETAGWNVLKNYGGVNARTMAIALFVGTVVMLGMSALWWCIDSDALPIGNPSTLEIILAIVATTLFHEALHLLGFPGLGLTSESVWGVWPRASAAFAQHMAPMPRNRFLFAALLPFLVISALPLLLHSLGIHVPHALQWIGTINGLGAGADLMAVG